MKLSRAKSALAIVFACALVGIPLRAIAAVDETLVKQWVGQGFMAGTCIPAANPYDLGAAQSDPDKVKNAWKFLKLICRDTQHISAHELVAAENYLFIRYAAGATGDTGFEPLSEAYYLLKSAASEVNFLQIFKTNPSNPVSDPDPDVRDWGDRGYKDGISDYQKRTGQPASLKTSAIVTAAKLLYDLYKKALN